MAHTAFPRHLRKRAAPGVWRQREVRVPKIPTTSIPEILATDRDICCHMPIDRGSRRLDLS